MGLLQKLIKWLKSKRTKPSEETESAHVEQSSYSEKTSLPPLSLPKNPSDNALAYGSEAYYFYIGNAFEDCVISMFDTAKFKIIHRTPTHKETGGRYVSSMRYPDLRFREISTGRTFWVEVKYRSHTGQNGQIEWCTETQLSNYRNTARTYKDPVFVLIGLGGTYLRPRYLYLIDLYSVWNWTVLYPRTYKNHMVCRLPFASLDELLAIAQSHKNA